MKQFILSTAVAVSLVFSVTAVADEPAAQDLVITGKVKSKLAAKHLSSVKVDANDQGVVRLTGKAPTQDASDLAATIAKNTDGVDAVYNSIVVAP